MSDALNYLVKARPDAMGHYFKFLKEAGRHLDPKTRDLISVITKVHAQTDRGFRQYLSRALREGCAPVEILDALLMAFPALGLAKIVWAVDILIDMNLPEFQPDAMGFPGEWHDVMAAGDIERRGHAPARLRRSRTVRPSHCRRIPRVRQPLSAPDHQHPAPRARRDEAHLSQARVGLRHHDRRLHRKGRHAAETLEVEGRRGRLLAYW